eukprot:m.4685 g.4685  ORF g.4685 m.4685 type:complete len:386 (+) comp11116_c0_seq1:68-1225(+)
MSKQPMKLMSVSAMSETNRGGRPYMEDCVAVNFEPNESGGRAFIGVFDGHGGTHASTYAQEHLWKNLKQQKGFKSKDERKVTAAIRQAFRETQNGMWKAIRSWPSSRPGVLSTAGTTASAIFLRGLDLYVGHLGDSRIVLARESDPGVDGKRRLVASSLTVDHKPEQEEEKSRIESLGGEVKPGNGGVFRVVWNRVRQPHCGPVLRSTARESVPFLNVARSLGDLWSYNYEKEDYVVSPDPDISMHKIEVGRDRFLVMASDGLWGVMGPQAAVDFVASRRRECGDPDADDENGSDVCHQLVTEALARWRRNRARADNVSVILVFFQDPSTESAAADHVERVSPTPPSLPVNSKIPCIDRKRVKSTKGTRGGDGRKQKKRKVENHL